MQNGIVMLIIGLVGGLGLFLLGMDFLSGGMKKMAGGQLRSFLLVVTRNRIGGVLFGTLFTILFQSSSAASVVLVGFIEAGLLTLKQSIPVLLGTGVGTTITVQLISFNFAQFSLLFVGIGFFAFAFGSNKIKQLGKTVLGFGLLLFGMKVMASAMEPLKESEFMIQALLHLKNPILGILFATIFTSLIQSSAAFIGILMVLASSGLISFQESLPLILGANIGTTITAVLATLKASRRARKMAFINSFVKIVTAIVFLFLLDTWLDVTLFFQDESKNIARGMANAHTIFNLGMVILLLPITNGLATLFDWLLPEPQKSDKYELRYLKDEDKNALYVPKLRKEIMDMGDAVLKMVTLSIDPFIDRNSKSHSKLAKLEEKVDFYRSEISNFLVTANRDVIEEETYNEVFRLLHLINELEQIADIVSVNILKQAKKWRGMHADFSEQGKEELKYYHLQCLKQLSRALYLVGKMDLSHALKMKAKYRKNAAMALDMEMKHYKRVFLDRSSTLDSSKIHMELLNLYRVINSRATNFGRILLMVDEQSEE